MKAGQEISQQSEMSTQQNKRRRIQMMIMDCLMAIFNGPWALPLLILTAAALILPIKYRLSFWSCSLIPQIF